MESAINNLEGFKDLKAAFENARDLNDQLTVLEKAVSDAKAAIENATDDAEAPGLGLNLEDFVSGAATADNDVYLFNADNANVSITSFGVTGQDTIYFGKEYTLKALGDDKITDNVGELDKLEIFWSVQGTTLTLYVEQETFAGNGSTTGDIVTVTLAGVAEDFTFEHGFLTAGEIA